MEDGADAATQNLPKQVVGLYSFPKSGNTWLRQILASGLEIPPNLLHRYVTDMHYGKIMQHPFVYENKRWYFYKSHHREQVTEHRGQVIRNDKILYIYRHPLDVFMSYLNFISKNVESKAGALMQFQFDSVDSLTPDQLDSLFSVFMVFGTVAPQNRVFGGYFEHVMSALALRDSGFPIHIMRYEDLHTDFDNTTRAVFEFLGIKNVDTRSVYNEADKRTAQDGKFFWKRQTDNYRNYLNERQIGKFMSTFEKEMALLGY